MQVQLVIINKSQRGQVIPVDASEFRIGRAEDCHYRLDSSWVSPYHCVIQSDNGTVTIQDSSGKKGTFVNSSRISTPQELKDGDKIRVGEFLFVVSIGADAEPTTTAKPSEPEEELEMVFELQRNARSVPMAKNQLFELARKGELLPDDVVTVGGTKVFADSISGIVFGSESSAVTSPTVSEAQKSEPFEYHELDKRRGGFPFAAASQSRLARRKTAKNSVKDLNPFEVADEPSVQIDRVPGAPMEITYVKPLRSLHEPLSQIPTWFDRAISHQIKIGGSVFAALCLLGVLVYFVMSQEGTTTGAVRITGTLTVDAVPVAGANVTFHPRCENGQRAIGMTNARGVFRVTTGKDPDGRGAVPGEYVVTFQMRPMVPVKYADPKTSEQYITVAPKGRNRFNFDLLSDSFAVAYMGMTRTPETGFFEKLPYFSHGNR